jgi:predicted  nucleic acid-binding Zn-ribbon protein
VFGIRHSVEMLPDLERLVRLQQIESAAEHARRRLDTLPADQQALDARLAVSQTLLDEVKARLAASQTARREIEKELAAVQSRLAKFKDQLMEVKTNKEYQAMQKEIATAEREVRASEDRVLERMEEAEALQADLRRAEAALKQEQAAVAEERKSLEAERARIEVDLRRLAADRASVVRETAAPALTLFESVSRQRRGVAVAEARDGHCSLCRVRLRPQVFNDVRRNDSLIQCESCGRILYFSTTAAAS